MQSAAISILSRAVELDQNKRYTEALLLYQEGIEMLIKVRKGIGGEKGAYYLKKIEEYMSRAEGIKKIVDQLKEQGKYHEQIEIPNGSTGFGYLKVFSRFMDADVTVCAIEDPYIRSYHQVQNLIRFIEVLLKSCVNVRNINLTTIENNGEQVGLLNDLRTDLSANFKVDFQVSFSSTLHDRKITLNNGWIVKIGRGLDYFKPPRAKGAIGTYDLDLRNCHETTIDIFHSNGIVQQK